MSASPRGPGYGTNAVSRRLKRGARRRRRRRDADAPAGRLGASTGEAVTVEVPDGAEVRPGPASLLAHSHEERLWDLRSMVLLGDLRRANGAWTFEPTRSIGGGEQHLAALLRGRVTLRRTAPRYLARRDLPRPRIAWAEFATLSAPGQGSQPTRPESAA
jgi:hypothetical protein